MREIEEKVDNSLILGELPHLRSAMDFLRSAPVSRVKEHFDAADLPEGTTQAL